MASDLGSFLAQLKAVVTEITKDGASTCSTWSDYLDRGIKLCESLPGALPEQVSAVELDTTVNEIEALSISLWNFSVSLKTKGQVTDVSNAKLRHMAFWVLEYCGQKTDSETSLKRLIMMGLKCGRAWLDGNMVEMADMVLSKTDKCIQRLQSLLVDKKTAAEGDTGLQQILDKHTLELDQDQFTLLCYRAEACIGVSRPDEALQHMMLAKELVPKFPKQTGFLSMLSYNIGVELYQQKLYNQTIIWLRESYELGKGTASIGSRNQARTLRLLANAYLDFNPEENLQNALNAVSLANTEHCHPAGLFLMLKILLLQSVDDNLVRRSLEELIKVPELTVDLGLHTLQLVKEHNRFEIVLWLIEELMKKFDHSADLGKLLITNTEVLIEANMYKEAKEFVEFSITAHHTGRQLDFSIKKRFHILFWEQAAAAYEKSEYQESLEWYNYSLSLYTQSDSGDLTLAKLHRNRANCYVHLQLPDKAQDALTESLKCDPASPQSHFLLFKLAIAQNDSQKASESLKKLCELQSTDQPSNDGDICTVSGLVALAAQHALESERLEAACVALENLVNTSPDIQQVLKALRCLIRLKLTSSEKEDPSSSDISEIVSHIETGATKLTQLMENNQSGRQESNQSGRQEYLQDEADWFMKIAWNVGLQCEDKPDHIMKLYTLCLQLLKIGVQDDRSLSRQKTCLVMSAAACLQVARTSAEQDKKKQVLEECLVHIGDCRQLCKKIQEHSIGIADGWNNETDILLLLYEFEARVHLKDSAVEAVLEKALTMPGLDPTTFETMAAIAIEPPAHNKSVAVRTIRVAIRKHLQLQNTDIAKCSKLFHSLIQLCLSSGSSHDVSGRQEAWNYYTEIFDVIDNKSKGKYPEMEIVWLMTKAWNCGINFYSCNRYADAEKWCAVSMRLLKYLDTTRNNYQEHMTSVYGDILSKMNLAGEPIITDT